mmetsp:Transcript_71112/g.183358  ORF Transcript_71112/g.183358 Transcript_71112/m.183358 type:complete len:606 (+) Transcript_71112:27-1844(+)
MTRMRAASLCAEVSTGPDAHNVQLLKAETAGTAHVKTAALPKLCRSEKCGQAPPPPLQAGAGARPRSFREIYRPRELSVLGTHAWLKRRSELQLNHRGLVGGSLRGVVLGRRIGWRLLHLLGILGDERLDDEDEPTHHHHVEGKTEDGDDHGWTRDAKSERVGDDPRADLAAGHHGHSKRDAGPHGHFLGILGGGEQLAHVHQDRAREDMKSDHLRLHRCLVAGAAQAAVPIVRVRIIEEGRHGEADEHHENSGDAHLDGVGTDEMSPGHSSQGARFQPHDLVTVRLRVLVLDDGADGESWQQHLQVDGVGQVMWVGDLAVGEEVHRLTQSRHARGVQHDRRPGDGHLELVHTSDHEGAEDGHEDEVDGELPLGAHVDGLEGDHQKQRVEVVEDGKDAGLLEDPRLLHTRRFEHREEDPRGGWRRKARRNERLLPGKAVIPQREHEVERAEHPREARGSHRHEVLCAILPDLVKLNLELEAHVDHDVRHTEHGDDLDNGLPGAVRGGVHELWDQLGADQPDEEVHAEEKQPSGARRCLLRLVGRLPLVGLRLDFHCHLRHHRLGLHCGCLRALHHRLVHGGLDRLVRSDDTHLVDHVARRRLLRL